MPIGEHESPTRKRADQWETHVFGPALLPDYDLIRADKINVPGHITAQILDHLIHDDLVILDFTSLNPNVLYEAAIRHVAKKPFIHIAPIGTRIPFDIKDLRTVLYDEADLKLADNVIAGIKAAVKEIESPDYKVPQIIKSQFDLEPIIKDPKAFVEMLTKHINIKSTENSGKIVEVEEWPQLSTGSFWSPKRVTCPKCGTITRMPPRLAPVSSFGIPVNSHYKCESCGTEFEPPQSQDRTNMTISDVDNYDGYNGVTMM